MGGQIRRIAGPRDETGWSDFIQFVEGRGILPSVGDLVDLAEISDDNLRTATTGKKRIVAVLKLSCINQGALPGTARNIQRKRCFQASSPSNLFHP